MREKLKQFIEEQGYTLSDEVTTLVEQLVDTLEAPETDVTEIVQLIQRKSAEYTGKAEEIGIKDLQKWYVDPVTGNIHHDSGKFFSIIGVRIHAAVGREVVSWTQPMIKQNECGILGILCQKKNGVRHYLLYAKYEPGNMPKIQLSPTLQATASNLKQVHGGKKPLFAEYFEDGGKGKILTSVEGVEDGGRFYLKTNRSMVIEVDENEQINAPDDYIWLTFPQLKKLLKIDGLANSLTRTVIGSL